MEKPLFLPPGDDNYDTVAGASLWPLIVFAVAAFLLVGLVLILPLF